MKQVLKPKSIKGLSPLGGLLVCALQGCAINFEITSQRTALENQMLGEYKDINSDLYLISSVRAMDQVAQNGPDVTKNAKQAQQNRIYNQDDIDELKNLQILGERADGMLTILPAGTGLVQKATSAQKELAKILVNEENHDRRVIWQFTISENANLKQSDLDKVKETFAKQVLAKAKEGHWFQSEAAGWYQKKGQTTQGQTQ